MKISSNISFGSTYVVSNRLNDYRKMDKFSEYCASIQDCRDVYMEYASDSYSAIPERSYNRHTLSVPDSRDIDVENFCLKNGIKFIKSENKNSSNEYTQM